MSGSKSMHDRIIAGELAVPTLNFCTQLVTTASGEPTEAICTDLEIEIDGSDMEDLASFSYCSGSLDFDSVTLNRYSYEIELDDEIEIEINQSVDGTMEPGDMDGTPAQLFDFGVSLLAKALEKMNTGAIANGRTIAELSGSRDNWKRIAEEARGAISNARDGVTSAQIHMNMVKTAVEENRTSDAIASINLAMSFLLGWLGDLERDQEGGS